MSAARSKAPLTARINDTSISLLPGETLLDAAHRQGIGIPYSCRVGGCATCKCRMCAPISGMVKSSQSQPTNSPSCS